MDRIADAMERARGNAVPAGAFRSNRATHPREDAGAGNGVPGSIKYTRTRTLEVDRKMLRERRIVGGLESGTRTDAYKILCTQVLQRLRDNGWNALAVTSARGGEGKTLTAINLAISLAREVDQTVLLVDADLRSPNVHRCFGLPEASGLSDFLIGNVALEQILVHPGIEHLVILPGGRPLLNSSEMLGSQKMMTLVQELKGRYPSRIVVFDLPPVLSAADSLAFSPYVDAAILVVEEGATDRDDLQRAAEMLSSTRLIGTVLNKSREAEKADPVQVRDNGGWLGRILRRSRPED